MTRKRPQSTHLLKQGSVMECGCNLAQNGALLYVTSYADLKKSRNICPTCMSSAKQKFELQPKSDKPKTIAPTQTSSRPYGRPYGDRPRNDRNEYQGSYDKRY